MKNLFFLILMFFLQSCVTIDFNSSIDLNNTSWYLINTYTDAPLLILIENNDFVLNFKNDSIYINNESSSSSSYYIKNDKLFIYLNNESVVMNIEFFKDSLKLSYKCSYYNIKNEYENSETLTYDENGDYLCILTFMKNVENQSINDLN